MMTIVMMMVLMMMMTIMMKTIMFKIMGAFLDVYNICLASQSTVAQAVTKYQLQHISAPRGAKGQPR